MACVPEDYNHIPDASTAIKEVNSRSINFPNYPEANYTYLTFSSAHGFQVNYIASGGRAWLWYPNNSRGLPEHYSFARVNGIDALCWSHPNNSHNPVTGKSGGGLSCQSLSLSRRTVISELRGDIFNLSTGSIPYKLDRCIAPESFRFDRERYGC